MSTLATDLRREREVSGLGELPQHAIGEVHPPQRPIERTIAIGSMPAVEPVVGECLQELLDEVVLVVASVGHPSEGVDGRDPPEGGKDHAHLAVVTDPLVVELVAVEAGEDREEHRDAPRLELPD